AIRFNGRDIAVLAIDTADTAQVRRGGAPYRRCSPLLRTFEVAAGIDNGAAVFIHGAELLDLFAGKMSRKRAEDGTGMDRISANAVTCSTGVECNGEECVGRLGLT